MRLTLISGQKTRWSRLCRTARLLTRDRSGVALIEFAYTLPIVLGLGCYALECANLVIMNERVNQISLNLADNASRVGDMQSDNSSQLREVDVADVLTAARLQGEKWGLTQYGRITLSSLEERGGKQFIHWQRCLGMKKGAGYDSSYGVATVDSATQPLPLTPGKEVPGMGETNASVTAPPDSGVMFAEINYDYQPVVGKAWLPAGILRLHYNASFIVRDKRVFNQLYNPAPAATRYTCDRYTTT
jgi:hypothetical protein